MKEELPVGRLSQNQNEKKIMKFSENFNSPTFLRCRFVFHVLCFSLRSM